MSTGHHRPSEWLVDGKMVSRNLNPLVLVRLFVVVALLAIIALTVVSFSFSREEIARFLLERVGKLHRLDDALGIYLTETKFWLVRSLLVLSTILGSIISVVVCRKPGLCLSPIQTVVKGTNLLLQEVSVTYRSLRTHEKWFLGLVTFLFCAKRLYDLLSLPINYDEAFTYLSFVSKDLWYIASYYENTNNHVLYSLVAKFWQYLPLDTTVALRVPSFFVGLGASGIIFFLAKKIFSTKSALAAFTFFSFSYPVHLYSLQGRGYMLLLFLFLVSLGSFLKVAFGSLLPFYWILYAFSSAFGFYTNPMFLYPHVTLFLFGILLFSTQRQYQSLTRLFVTEVATGILTLLLYSPSLLVSGLNDFLFTHITQTDFIFTAFNLARQLYASARWLMGGNAGVLILAVVPIIYAILIWRYYQNRNIKILAAFLLFLFLTPSLYMYLQKNFPAARTWFYVIVVPSFGLSALVFLVEQSSQRIADTVASLLCVGIIALHFLGFPAWHREHFAQDYVVGSYIDSLPRHDGLKGYSNYFFFDTLYQYKNRQKPFDLDVDHHFIGNKKYDFIVLDKTEENEPVISSSYQLDHDSERFQVWKRTDGIEI